MQSVVRRGLVLAALTATLGAVPAISYADEPVASPTPTATATATATPVDPVTAILNVLGDNPAAPLTDQLAALTPAQIRTLLSNVSAGALPNVVAQLTPAQIGGLGGFGPAITGLQAVATGLGSAPTAAQVNTLLAQVNALMAATAPADLGQLNGLLAQLAPLLVTPGLDSTAVNTLFQAAHAAALSSNPPSAIATILTVLITGSTKAPVATVAPTATPTAATKAVKTPKAPAFTAYRVKVVRVKVSADGRHAYVVLRCPGSVDGAIADLTGSRGGRSAFRSRRVVLAGNANKVVTVTLAKGKGALKIAAATRGSSLPPSVKRATL